MAYRGDTVGSKYRHDDDDNDNLWSGIYTALALGQLVSAAFVAAKPHDAADLVFGAAPHLQDDSHKQVFRLLGAGLVSGAATALALAEVARRRLAESDTPERLRLGLGGLGAVSLAVAAAFPSDLTNKFRAIGGVTFGATAAIPLLHILTKEDARRKAGDMIKNAFEGAKKLFRFRKFRLVPFLHAVLTPAFVLLGASHVFAPSRSMEAILGVARGEDSLFVWRQIGSGLLTVLPAVTYTLKTKADRKMQDKGIAQVLNVGLLTTSLGYLAVLGPILYDNNGGDFLPLAVGTWAAGAIASGVGIAQGRSGVDEAKEE